MCMCMHMFISMFMYLYTYMYISNSVSRLVIRIYTYDTYNIRYIYNTRNIIYTYDVCIYKSDLYKCMYTMRTICVDTCRAYIHAPYV